MQNLNTDRSMHKCMMQWYSQTADTFDGRFRYIAAYLHMTTYSGPSLAQWKLYRGHPSHAHTLPPHPPLTPAAANAIAVRVLSFL